MHASRMSEDGGQGKLLVPLTGLLQNDVQALAARPGHDTEVPLDFELASHLDGRNRIVLLVTVFNHIGFPTSRGLHVKV